MFTWVTQGIAEPYIPSNKSEIVKRVTPSHQGVPDKSIRVNEDTYKPHKKNFSSMGNSIESYSQEEIKNDEFATPVFAREIMSTSLHTAYVYASLSSGESILNKNRIRYIPIISRDNKILGIVSHKDILLYTIQLYRKSPTDIEKSQLGDIMKTKILTGYPDTAIREIAKIMFEESVGALPIISRESSDLVGIVTRNDILKSVMLHTSMNLYI